MNVKVPLLGSLALAGLMVLFAFITAARLRRTQQPRLTDHVRKLQAEFEDRQ